jgi:hypothetical protein
LHPKEKRPTVLVVTLKQKGRFSMSTLQKLQHAVKHVRAAYIPKAKARRFLTGVNQLALREFTSLNAAGRAIGVSRSTGENRIRRTITDDKLADHLQQLLVTEMFQNQSGYLYCSMDHSQFGPFCIAVLAVSRRKGRAIPIWVQVNLSEAALIAPLLIALEQLFIELRCIAPKLKPVLVMDRWFASDKLFKLFEAYGVYFIARTKSDKRIQLPWDPSWWKIPIQEVSQLELFVTYRTHKLRLVCSELRPDMKDPEPWFLLTNLPEEITRTMVLHRYAERFEIEEAFKDVKWLERLEWQQVRKPEIIRNLLLFTFLGWWLLWRYVTPTVTRQTPQKKLHPKKRLSWFRLSWEELQRLLRTPLLPQPVLQGVGKK